MATTVEQMARQIKTLTDEEQAQLRALLEGLPSPVKTTPEAERATLEYLLAKGVIARIPNRYREGYLPDARADDFTPVPVIGRPVSETLLEDRGPR